MACEPTQRILSRINTIAFHLLIASALVVTLSCAGSAKGENKLTGSTRPPQLEYKFKNFRVLAEKNGGRVDWSHKLDLIAFDSAGEDGFFDIYIMKPDGMDRKCLTCNMPGVPQKHNGNPAWHPSGKYIVFQGQKEDAVGSSIDALPGYGRYCDLWIMTLKGDEIENIRPIAFHKVVDIPNDVNHSILHPHFSADGTKLSWSEMYDKPGLTFKGGQLSEGPVPGKGFGYWTLKVADFSVRDGKPTLSNIREFQPGGQAWYENHGFSPDGGKLLFTANLPEGSSVWSSDIYTLDLVNGTLTQLTKTGYNEHASFSPNGSKIAWMTNTEISNQGTEYWVMNADGTGKERITHFNEPGHPEYFEGRTVPSDCSWSPEGRSIVGFVQPNLLANVTKQGGMIIVIELK